MTDQQKSEITTLVAQLKETYVTNVAVGNKLGASPATISLILNGKWEGVRSKMWLKIAGALKWKSKGWQVVETNSTRMVTQVFNDAKEEGMWMAISNPAGSSKTESCNMYQSRNLKGVFCVKCWEWEKKIFLKELSKELGLPQREDRSTADDLLRKIVIYVKQRFSVKPLLIIDEADKLRPSALRTLIPLYNELEGILGVVMLGTENLYKEIKRGVEYNVKGYDEIDSRFGRSYIKLIGATKKEVINITKANGIENEAIGVRIFNECSPVQKVLNGQQIKVVQDMRRVKRAIQRELRILSEPQVAAAG